MSVRSRIPGLLTAALVVGTVFFTLKGLDRLTRPAPPAGANLISVSNGSAPGTAGHPAPALASISPRPVATPASVVAEPDETEPPRDPRFPHRLRNTTRPIEQLARMDSAVLLENAFLDTARGIELPIPDHLRAEADPGSFIVQSHAALDNTFYGRLREAGAEFIAYVPNHAALVRADAAAARQLAALPSIRAVLPYEPYFKVAQNLLSFAVEEQALPPEQLLNLVLFPGEREATLTALETLGMEAIAEDRTPFGPLVTIVPLPDSLPELARLRGVQRIEPSAPRVLLNDRARVRMRIAEDTFALTNHFNLTGTNIIVNVNDTGVDAQHPDLRRRVFSTDTNAFTLEDRDGHGTHVAVTLAGSGAESESVSNAFGSFPGADFRGMAPHVDLFVLPIDLGAGPLVSDSYLQESAATNYFITEGRANAFISNNSWAYDNQFDYNSAAASYDAAVRNALPFASGPHPGIYVFGAGNQGFGLDSGIGGVPGSILSPATAKNVITVGALEQHRLIDLELVVTNSNGTVTTNRPFRDFTDSDNEVASFSSRGNVGIGTEGPFGRFKPDVVAPGVFLVSGRSQFWDLEDDIPTDSPLYPILSNLNHNLEPHYRFESGTSMAAPVISGLLALVQEFFEDRLERAFSPALMKALLINSSRTVNSAYDLQPDKILNYQGWGLPVLNRMLPIALTNRTDETDWPIRFIDQGAQDAIATGQTHTWNLELSTNALFRPLRVTLVWTDPPGNPGSAIKLVNDLDLVITNLVTGEVYVGNDIPEDFDFNQAHDPEELPRFDFINNVENVFLPPVLSTNYSISVIGRRVNVNANTLNTTDVVQDYALVISYGDGESDVEAPFESLTRVEDTLELKDAVGLTNGVPLLNQRVGANFQLLTEPEGATNQWRFYIFTNAFVTNVSVLTNGSNIAFITFIPPNLARPRNLEADIDLYVSQNPALTNLDPAVVEASFKSRSRGGTELIVFTNAVVNTNEIYYIGVKSEDQQAAEFGIVALSTDLPFDELDEDGNRVLRGLPTNVEVPDGSPNDPGAAYIFAVGIHPDEVGNTLADLELFHESVGDLLGNLSHLDQFAVLNNHDRFDGGTNLFYSLTYDDSGSGQSLFSRPTDGPGSLNDFIGLPIPGVWLFTMTDNTLGRTGRVENLTLRIQPNLLALGDIIFGSVLANQWVYYSIEVPADATSMQVILSNLDPPLPLELYVRRGAIPDFDNFDKRAFFDPPGGILELTRGDVPPLNAGRYFIGIYNPNAVTVDFNLQVLIDRDLDAVNRGSAIPDLAPLPLLDDAITRSTLFVPNARPIVEVQAGVIIEHARASDLVLHLVSPAGTRVLLAENRGRTSPDGYGAHQITTHVVPRTSEGGAEEDRALIETGTTSGIIEVEYEFFDLPDSIRIYYEGVRLFDSGLVSGAATLRIPFGPGTSTEIEIVVNEGGSSFETTQWTYTASVISEQFVFAVFTDNTNRAELPIKFASAPFTNSPISSAQTNWSVFQDGFESVIPGLYQAPTNVGPWFLNLGQVRVHDDSNPLGVSANTGTNFLELVVTDQPSGLGVMLDTTVNRQYVLRFAARRNPLGPAGSPQVVGVYTNGVLADYLSVPTGPWSNYSVLFQAVDTATTFQLRSASAVGPLLDSVEILEIADDQEFYFLPEERLRPFEGESAFGDWTLEILDDRSGPDMVSPPHLVLWELRFILANTNPPAIPLEFCRPDTNTVSVYLTNCEPALLTVSGDEIKYFIVETPRVASLVTNIVWSTNDLVLLYNSGGLPTGQLPGDVVVDDFGAGGTTLDGMEPVAEFLILNTNDPPQLRPGQRYYLGVANANPTETNTFRISATFDQTDSFLINVTELTNGIPFNASIPRTNALDYYQFTVSSNATEVRFELFPDDGNVDLVVRQALPVRDPLPTTSPGRYDYISRNPGIEPELIAVTTVSEPAPLEPGRWYLGVVNVDTNTVSYTVQVTEFTDSLTNVITLQNGVPVDFTIPAGATVTNYFVFSITDPAEPAVLFEVYNLTGDATLLTDLNQVPTPLDFFADATGAPAQAAQIVLRTNIGPPELTGDWFLRVVPENDIDLSFTIRAVLSADGMLISDAPFQFSLVPIQPPGSGFELTWNTVPGERYRVLRSTDLITWIELTVITATTSTASFQDLAPPPEPNVFYAIEQVP
jgi:subtilisin-like proprotein convertase family protein